LEIDDQKKTIKLLDNIVGRASIPQKIPIKPPNMKSYKSASKLISGKATGTGPQVDLLKG